jgi:hypothetical protein
VYGFDVAMLVHFISSYKKATPRDGFYLLTT